MKPKKYLKQTFTDWESLGKGSFGKIYTATRNDGTQVAIKIVKRGATAVKEKNIVAKLHHKNVVKLFGTIMPDDDEPECEEDGYEDTGPWLVMEYLPYGNLRDYVQHYPSGCPYSGMIWLARGIAKGMAYLHSEGIVHGDLAARNILVGRKWSVKICDFGHVSDDDHRDEYYYKCPKSNYPYPIRWMPHENLPSRRYQGEFTKEGDIWAFGVVLFEIWSRGELPYCVMEDKEVMKNVREGNNPLTYISVNVRHCVKQLMEKCWEWDEDDRPNFKTISETLDSF